MKNSKAVEKQRQEQEARREKMQLYASALTMAEFNRKDDPKVKQKREEINKITKDITSLQEKVREKQQLLMGKGIEMEELLKVDIPKEILEIRE